VAVRPFECGMVCLPQDNGFETLPFLSTNGFNMARTCESAH
jgi:hypothetical protein